ncbi:DUF2490 domain-containing protein [Cognataquiflexum aquatile]|uniref:DUF2490 domain-containing protein n=1 Tax=Cognataquiflexum aquatile TaxID=2249427 RepID=UPI000DE8C812|nr:DUF2490 domain-containing protein [Cognataquiflexum aquatile]
MKVILVLIIYLIITNATAQENQTFFTGIFPEVSLTKKISDVNKLNFKIENQRVLFDNRDKENPQFTHYRTDLMMFFDHSVRPGVSMALGIFHRFQENENSNRIIQQFAVLQRMRNLRINHRIRTDQTFTRNDDLELRMRYRISGEIPLQGKIVDPKEFYLVISEELIFSYKGGDFEIENRVALALGKLYNSREKLEWGVDYRTDGFIQDGFRTRLWGKISYFYNF